MSGTLQHTLLPYVFVLTFDAILWLLAWLLLITNSVGVTWLWCYRLVCWGILHYLAQLINIENGQTVLTRWVAALCLTSPAYEAGKTLGLFNSSNNCTVPDVGMVVLYVASASMACLLWEWGFPDKANGDNGKEKKKQEARALLMRVMRYSAPDYLYLAAAFLFLTLTALGECAVSLQFVFLCRLLITLTRVKTMPDIKK